MHKLNSFVHWCATSLFEVRCCPIPSVHIVCTKCAFVKSELSVHKVCIKCTSLYEKSTLMQPVLAVLLNAQQGFQGTQTTADLQILPATSRSESISTNACHNVAKTCLRKTPPSCGRNKASKAPKPRQTSRPYPSPHVLKVSAEWVHSNKHHNTSKMRAVISDLTDLGCR